MKLVIGSLVILSLVILFLFALFPSQVSVTRMVRINSTGNKILDTLSDMRTWKKWNEFVQQPENTKIAGTEPDSIWADHLQINGNEIYLSGVDASHVHTLWTKGERMFVGEFTIDVKSGSPVLIWTMIFDVRWYPWEKLASMFYDRQLGPEMEKSLVQLRDKLESP